MLMMAAFFQGKLSGLSRAIWSSTVSHAVFITPIGESLQWLRAAVPRILTPASASIGATCGARRATLSRPILR